MEPAEGPMMPQEGECRFGRVDGVTEDCCLVHGEGKVEYLPALCSVAADALRARYEELEQGLVRMCPPGKCKVMAPNECTCIVVVAELRARLTQAEARVGEAKDEADKYHQKLCVEIERTKELQSLLATWDEETERFAPPSPPVGAPRRSRERR